MIATLILVISLAALLEFFVSYCRSLIAAGSRVELSEQAREVTGIQSRAVRGEEFHRLVQLVGLCPEPADERFGIRAVRAYYRLLSPLRAMFNRLVPSVALWAEHEREGCAYYAAVALDRRISYSRDLMARQMGTHL